MPARHPSAVGVDVIRAETLALADVAAASDLTTPVPTCGQWTMADLTWHLAEVQAFWAHIIENRPAGPETYSQPTRPDDETTLAAGLRDACHRLTAVLGDADPDEQAWSWAAEQTVAFTIRRQSHEALVHHMDGRLAAGLPIPAIDPHLAADGVDEILTVMLCEVNEWASFERTSGSVTLDTTDTDDSWDLAFGRFTGTEPSSGTAYDLTTCEPAPGLHTDATIEASSAELLLWLWGRLPDGAVSVSGDAEMAARLRATLAELA